AFPCHGERSLAWLSSPSSLAAGRKRSRGPSLSNRHWYSRLTPKAWVRLPSHTRNRGTTGLTFVGLHSRLTVLGYSAPHLSFLLVRLGSFAADYFRDNPSALRAAGASGTRCNSFCEADTRLIAIGELDASRLKCSL